MSDNNVVTSTQAANLHNWKENDMSQKTPKRLYRVDDSHGNTRMVWAFNRAIAIRHAAENDYSAHLASQAEIIDMVRHGVPEEMAGETRRKDEPMTDRSLSRFRQGGAA